jgi:N-acetylglucosaminyldiphosphoundecaprenol N-acetyl-beta-D-mannosaminyltransferase
MRATFLGCPIDILTMAETVELVHMAMRSRRRLQHVAINVAKLVNMRRDPILAGDIISSDLVGIDGMGIVWGAKCLGLSVGERVAGIDLFTRLLEVCAKEGFKPYFLGGTQEVVLKAADQARLDYPGICFAGLRDGYFKPDQEPEIVRQIRESEADCLFIGMPTPRKERFLAAHRDSLNIPFIMGVGGSFDILAGKVFRAPKRVQALGLEWLYRIYQEPRRMWWRYAQTNAFFAGILARAVIRRCLIARPKMSRAPQIESSWPRG